MLKTPIGDLIIRLNKKQKNYTYVELDNIKKSFNVNCRYKITIDISESKESLLECFILVNNIFKSSVESGENLASLIIKTYDYKLSLGICDDNNLEAIDYFENGLSKVLVLEKSLNQVVIGVAWKNNDYNDYDHSTWFASDPTIFDV